MTADSITEAVRRLADDAEVRRALEENIAPFGRDDVGKRIYEEIVGLIAKKNGK